MPQWPALFFASRTAPGPAGSLGAEVMKLPNLKLEQKLWESDYAVVAGLDEAGRGAWAGPVAAAAIAFPPNFDPKAAGLVLVRDSKRLSPQQREALYTPILCASLSFGIGFASRIEIDQMGIAPATRLAMMRAVSHMRPSPDFLLLDYVRLPESDLPQRSLKHGDALVFSISAASILAKVARDRLLMRMSARYPGYGFERHKGYGTEFHRDAIARLGVSWAHRLSFRPMSDASNSKRELD